VGGVVYNLHKRFRRRVHNYFTQESQWEGWYIFYTGVLGDVFHNYFTQEF
jgi:hypothetical protein